MCGGCADAFEVGILTPEEVKRIDDMDYETMLRLWRFSPAGNEMFIGERGNYFSKVMFEKRDKDPSAAIRASKAVGWEK